MKIVVFTYDRVDTASTPGVLEAAGLDYLVVCHSPERMAEYVAHGTVRQERIVTSCAPMGLANNRNWYIDNILRDGEWCLMLVDDWLQAYELDTYELDSKHGALPITIKNNSQYNARFRKAIDMRAFYQRACELRSIMERAGILLGGFAGYANPLFRGKQWRRNVLADGRAWVMRKSDLRLDPNVQMVDDMCFCAQNIFCGTGTLVNQWVLPDCKRYTAGAYGSIKERTARKLTECRYLVGQFPGLVRYANKPGWPAGSHVKLTATTPARAERLRGAAAG